MYPTEDEKKRKEWRKIDGRARRVLTNGLSDDDHTAIRDCKTAKEVLEKIVSLYESTAGENKYLLSQKLHQLKFEANQTVAGYCSQLIVLVQRLKTAGEKVSDTAMVSKLITDLPAKFDNFRQAYLIQAASGVVVTFERLRNQLQLVEASFENEKTDAANSGNALVANRSKGDTSGGKQKKETRKCHHCKKIGHLKRDCRKLKSEQSAQAQQATSESGSFLYAAGALHGCQHKRFMAR